MAKHKHGGISFKKPDLIKLTDWFQALLSLLLFRDCFKITMLYISSFKCNFIA